jgi:hypothetical protein
VAAPQETLDPGRISLSAFSSFGDYRDDPGDGNIPIDNLNGFSPAHFIQIPAQPVPQL